eukprot:TRINITY_DN13739_c0_g1_i1.p1 TRINITY_DN13739_c0_g1~~TRINITY_DN13739_c0_g1_i1.p1  ORF type:complete len:124 (-),score=25.89 TRINITY_DN13739_c0_g1_i1:60-431(-)
MQQEPKSSFQRRKPKTPASPGIASSGETKPERRRFRKRAKSPTYDNIQKFNDTQQRNATKKYSELEAAIAIRIEKDFGNMPDDLKKLVNPDNIKESWKRFYYWQKENEVIEQHRLDSELHRDT